ncbi:MAG: PKD domain-containing protein [Flavobacteriales bacterium]|nr:PKD domain-containing protein [Flavobacteriales bacterium]MDW8432332.1 PKD domain-containing protein [Flavobacteriales bacterium]
MKSQRPTLITPQHGLCADPASTVFSWDAYPGATSYTLEIATQPDFAGAAQYSAATTSYAPSLSSGQAYFWRVRANTSGGPSQWSFPRLFLAYTPNDFNGCLFWGSALGLNLPNNSGVQTWPTLSSSGQSLFQNTPAKQPIYKTSGGFRNWPRIFFPGNSEYFTSNITTAQIPNNSPMQIFQFGKCYNQSLGFLYYIGNAGVLSPTYTCRCAATEQNDGRYRALAYDGALSAFTFDFFTPNSSHALVTVSDVPGGNARIFKNSVLQNSSLSAPVPVNAAATLKLGADQAGSLPGYFEVQEFLVYNSNLTDTQRTIIEKYILDKYAPPVNLGPDLVANGICTNTLLDAGNYFASYLWSTGATTPTITVTSLGTYWVQVTDPFGRVSADTIRVLPPFNFYQLNDGYLCSGSTLVWDPNVPPGYTLTWSDGSSGSTLSITQPGNYYLTVTDANSCSFHSDTATLILDPFPTADLGSNLTLCAGNFLAFDLPVGPGAQFQWSNGASDTLLVVNTSGTYWAIATNANNCTASDTVQVTISGTAPLVDFSTSTRCAGDTILFNSIVNGNILSYQWQFGSGITNSQPNAAFLFTSPGPRWVTLKVVAQSGCTGQKTKVLNILPQPNASFSFTTDPCMYDTTFFQDLSTMPGGNIIQWQWNFGDPGSGSLNFSSLQHPHHLYTAAGVYSVTLKSFNDSLCSRSVTLPVFVLPSAIPDFVYDRTCIQEPVKFNAQVTLPPGVSLLGYLWNFGNGNASTLPNPQQTYPAGTYTVSLRVNTIANNKVCKAFAVKTLNINKDVTAGFELPDSVCAGTPVILLDTGSAQNDVVALRRWRISDLGVLTGQNISYSFPQEISGWRTIRLVVQTLGGCLDSVQKMVFVKPSPKALFEIIPAGGPAPLPVSFTNASQGASGYSWFLNGSPLYSGFLPPDITLTQEGLQTITLVATGPNGCRDTLHRVITLDPPGIGLRILGLKCEKEEDFLTFQVTLLNGGSTEVSSAELLATGGLESYLLHGWNGVLPPGDSLTFVLNSALRVSPEVAFCCVTVDNYNQGIQLPDSVRTVCSPLISDFWVGMPYPNPATGENIGVFVFLPWTDDVLISIQDAAGRRVYSQFFEKHPAGLHNFQFSLPDFRSASLVLRLEYRDQKVARKILFKK